MNLKISSAKRWEFCPGGDQLKCMLWWRHDMETLLSLLIRGDGKPRQGPWWRHQMETIFTLLALCTGNSPVTGEFFSQRPVTRSFDVFFYLRLNKRLSKQSWGWWLETPSRSLCRHFNASHMWVWVLMFRFDVRFAVSLVRGWKKTSGLLVIRE